MRRSVSTPASFKKFKRESPRTAAVPGELATAGFLAEKPGPPRVFTPAVGDVDACSWAADRRRHLDEELLKYGAVLFRGFDLSGAVDFEAFAESLCPELFGDYEDLPDETDGRNIYRSTPYPADKTILFHNESSHLHRWPRKQLFFCAQPAREGGETPIVDCREMYRRLDPEIRDSFESKGLLYVRNFVDGFDVSWRDFFATEEREAVARYCRDSGFEHQWLDGDQLRVRRRAQAVVRHPETGETSFFNQIQLHHPYCLEPDARESLLEMFGEDGLPRSVMFGDGTPIPDATMERVGELYWELAVQFSWQRGDVLMVDNMITAHARNPFAGERKTLVAMGEIVHAPASDALLA